jgi:hypothetical protein
VSVSNVHELLRLASTTAPLACTGCQLAEEGEGECDSPSTRSSQDCFARCLPYALEQLGSSSDEQEGVHIWATPDGQEPKPRAELAEYAVPRSARV